VYPLSSAKQLLEDSMNGLKRLIVALAILLWAMPAWSRDRWSTQQASEWSQKTGWLVGCNFIPSTAINELEMWQADSFDLPTIDRELGFAEKIGFNSVRVFLHNIPWEQDPDGYLKRIDQFLDTAHQHKIGVVFVLFDSCWDPHPMPGKQRDPKPGVHNSGWVQCPGADVLEDPAKQEKLQAYVKGIVGHLKDDPRVNIWDVWNEPDNLNNSSYGDRNLKQEPADKVAKTLPLLAKAFEWAREADPSQPLSSGVWQGDWDTDNLSECDRIQLDNSDVITFHAYDPLERTRARIQPLKKYGRPLVCTEYMARPIGSTFETMLPFFKSEKIGAFNWGFVSGKSNTIYAWDTWQHPATAEPKVWFHDIFRPDGTPFDSKEIEAIERETK
jgi:hypothetical protein